MTYTAHSDQQTAWLPQAGQPYQQYEQYRPAARRRVGAAGLVTSLAGVVAIIVSFTSLSWFTEGTVYVEDDRSGSFGIIHEALVRISLASGFQVRGNEIAAMYFTWLGWGLLVAVTFAALLANTATAAAPVFRVVGAVFALGSVALTFAAIDLISVAPGTPGRVDPPYSEYLSKAGPGFYAALIGFVLLAVGSLLGSRKRS